MFRGPRGPTESSLGSGCDLKTALGPSKQCDLTIIELEDIYQRLNYVCMSSTHKTCTTNVHVNMLYM